MNDTIEFDIRFCYAKSSFNFQSFIIRAGVGALFVIFTLLFIGK